MGKVKKEKMTHQQNDSFTHKLFVYITHKDKNATMEVV